MSSVSFPRLVGSALLAVSFACATVPPPQESISSAELSVRKADESHAVQHAPLDLVKAREKLELARIASMDKDTWVDARRLAEQAEVDAQLAEEKARAAQASTHAREMERSVELLKYEVGRQRP